MRARTFSRAVMTLFGCVSVGCSEASAPVAVAAPNGSFALTLVDGKTLPDTETTVLGRQPGDTLCVVQRTSGTLAIDSTARKFSISLNARNVCTNEQWVILTEDGTYTLAGQSLTVFYRFPDHVDTLPGKFDSQQIEVHGVRHVYTFAR